MERVARFLAISAFALITPLQAAAAPCAGFTDVDDSDPFCTHVGWIKNRNITAGCTATLYCPHEAATRLQMAAFLNRLGDVLLPPNVIWVAPVGGQFQSIQAAIDYGSARPLQQWVVNVAPGTYSEAISMAPNVDVHGSGVENTRILASVCSAGEPTVGTVTSNSGGTLSRLTVETTDILSHTQCAAVVLAGSPKPLRDVAISVVSASGFGAATFGIRSTSITMDPPMLLERVSIAAFHFAGASTGVFASGGGVRLRDVDIVVRSDSTATALRFEGAEADLDRVEARAAGFSVPTGGILRTLIVDSGSIVRVQRSSLWSSAQTYASNIAGTLRVAYSLLEGSLVGSASCIGNYNPTFAPVSC